MIFLFEKKSTQSTGITKYLEIKMSTAVRALFCTNVPTTHRGDDN